MQELINNHLDWLTVNGAILTSSKLEIYELVIGFYRREDGSWYYNAPW